jgi:hypothetical protein
LRTRGSSGSTGGTGARAAALIEHVGNRLRGEGTAPRGVGEGGLDFEGAILIEQVEEPRGRAAEMSAVDDDLVEE